MEGQEISRHGDKGSKAWDLGSARWQQRFRFAPGAVPQHRVESLASVETRSHTGGAPSARTLARPANIRRRAAWVVRLHPLWAFLSYAAITALLFHTIVRHLGGRLPSDPGDPVLNTWILWWNSRTVPLTPLWWNAPAFYPSLGVLTFSEHLLGIALISSPVIWLTGDPVVGYNVAFLQSFPLSGLLTYLLCLELTGRRDAAWVGGLAYAFAPYRMSQLAHLQVLSSYWAPLGLFGLHRYCRDGRARWLVVFAFGYAMQGLCNGYFFIFFSVLVALWVIWFVLPFGNPRRLVAIGGAWAVAATVMVPVLLMYRGVHSYYGVRRHLDEITSFSADVLSLVSPARWLDLWGRFHGISRAEGEFWMGLTLALLIAVGLWRSRWLVDRVEPRWLVRVRWGVAILAGVFLAGIAVAVVVGPWEIELLGLRLRSTRTTTPITPALQTLFILAVISPPVVSAWRRRSAFAFYLIAAFLLWLLTLGPYPVLLGKPVLTHGPYLWLMQLPGLDGLRVPARFWTFAMLCLAVAAGLALARAVAPTSRARHLVVAMVAAGLLAEMWSTQAPTARIPARSPALEGMATGPVVELPIHNRDADLAAMFRSMYHGRPVVNGHSGYYAPHYAALAEMLNAFDPAALKRLSGMGVRDVRVDRRNDVDRRCEAYVSRYPDVVRVADDEAEILFRLPPATPDPEWDAPSAYGPALAVAHLRANTNEHLLTMVQDGDLLSRWHTGPQRAGDEVEIELVRARPIGAVVLTLGPYLYDFPRELSIEVSDEGHEWAEAWRGRTALPTYDAGFRDPRRLDVAFPLGGRSARLIRLRQLGQHESYYWSVAELAVLAPAGDFANSPHDRRQPTWQRDFRLRQKRDTTLKSGDRGSLQESARTASGPVVRQSYASLTKRASDGTP